MHAASAAKSLIWAREYWDAGDVTNALNQARQAAGLYGIAKDKDGVKRANAIVERLEQRLQVANKD